MKAPTSTLRRPADDDLQAPSATIGVPAAGEVLAEIGCLLAAHLAVAFVVTLVLRAAGIA